MQPGCSGTRVAGPGRVPLFGARVRAALDRLYARRLRRHRSLPFVNDTTTEGVHHARIGAPRSPPDPAGQSAACRARDGRSRERARDGEPSRRPGRRHFRPSHSRHLGGAEPQRGEQQPEQPDLGDGRHHLPTGGPGALCGRSQRAVRGPQPRYISNRIFNDSNQNLYSQRNVSQWAFVWGQFTDHTIAQRLGRRMVTDPGETANIVMDNSDPLESFPSAFGIIPFDRSRPAPDTGVTNPREQVNTLNSYLDAETVYGNTDDRLDWIRAGTVDGNPDNNQAALLLADGYLPRRDSRGDAATAPNMVAGGHLAMTPHKAAVAGDPRANENPSLLGTHTLFAREHNRIVSQLPRWMSQQDKFQIARAVVIAEQQYITYNDFLPALGVNLPTYRGYKPNVDVSVSNEFATVGFRAHSQIRGDFRLEAEVGRYSQETLDRLADMGIEVTTTGNKVHLMIPLGEDAFFNPDLLELVELGPLLQGIGERPQNRNDEQISNMLRSFPSWCRWRATRPVATTPRCPAASPA
ncbi:peroxidase family protein [Phytohabitans flavus]|uniref:peroxidase family protein n=1 Tax=Phytohabitans flavus TaxID=1076124 RepID=UPI0036373C5E